MTILKFDREEDHMLTEGKKRSFLGKLSRKIGDALMGRAAVDEAVSYTHLDVYKRQPQHKLWGSGDEKPFGQDDTAL